MPDENPRSKVIELEERVKALEQFCKDLIKSIQQGEKKHKLILLPEGVYFGITIE